MQMGHGSDHISWVKFSVKEDSGMFPSATQKCAALPSLLCSQQKNAKLVAEHEKSRSEGSTDAFGHLNIYHCVLKSNHLQLGELCSGGAP